MWLDSAAQDAVDLFWQRCGEPETYPRSLVQSVSIALPIALIFLPRLHLSKLESWLQQRDIHYQFRCQDRVLRGCLVAFGGQGFVFVEGADPDDERRFTIAHEVAHFMLDYWLPREKAAKLLGPEITDVFDGLRSPTFAERVHALLANLNAGVHTDLMERSNATDEVWKVEDCADRVAMALLAPPDAVLESADVSAPRFEQRRQATEAALCNQFGLPACIAHSYAYTLLCAAGKGPSWSEAFRRPTV
jgi:hypothetical protein